MIVTATAVIAITGSTILGKNGSDGTVDFVNGSELFSMNASLL